MLCKRAARQRVPIKAKNFAIFDNLNVGKCFVDIDVIRYAKDGVTFDYALNDYFDYYSDLELFHKVYVGEEILNLFITYTVL